MTTNRDRAAEVIGNWIDNNLPHDETLFGADEGLTEALADAGLLSPDLPEPDEWDEVVLLPREGKTTVIKDEFTGTTYSIPGARSHALDMLAAAAHAERNQK